MNQKAILAGFSAANKTYDGTTSATVQPRILTGVIGADDVSLIGGTATFDNANAGTGKTVTLTDAILTGAAAGNYSLTSISQTTADITKATVTITGDGLNGSGYFGAYDGQAHAATATVTGVGGANLEQLTSNTTHRDAGIYSDTLTYTDQTGNYQNASRVVKSYILKATVTITGDGLNGSGYFGTYDAVAHAATATVTGVSGAVLGQLVSSMTHRDVGIYSDTVMYTDGTGNYNNASRVVKSYILKATVTITGDDLNGSGYYGTYDGQAHAATATVTGVGGVVLGQLVSSTTHTDIGIYSDTVTFLGDANYKVTTKVLKSYIIA